MLLCISAALQRLQNLELLSKREAGLVVKRIHGRLLGMLGLRLGSALSALANGVLVRPSWVLSLLIQTFLRLQFLLQMVADSLQQLGNIGSVTRAL
jgi:hypothetical protein